MSIKNIKWLTTLDLENFINNYADKNTKNAFLGIFPINLLPAKIPHHLPILFVVNTNPSNLPGQHWKAVYVSKDRNGEVFDSLAMPIDLRLEHWMNKFCRKWTVSKLILQNPFSPSCGAYVLYYILSRLCFNSLNACLAPFNENVLMNDRIVEEFVQSFL